LPRMAWALWRDQRHRAAKLHLHFEVARGIPVEARVTAGQASEVGQLRQHLQAGRLYVLDRGYAGYSLPAVIRSARASLIVRVKECRVLGGAEPRALSPEAQAAGVLQDVVVARLGTSHHKREVHRPVRVVTLN